jgi:hypothetical protein
MYNNVKLSSSLRFVKLICLIAVLFFSACSDRKNLSPFPTITDAEKEQLNKPVNCQNARRDIQVLEEEKVSVGKQILSGVRSVMPISVVAGILMGDYMDRVEVASGEYNDDLAAKIEQIRTQCGVY